MVTHLNYNTRNLKFVGKRKRPRRRWGSYKLPIAQRALAAAEAIEQGTPRKRACALHCACGSYVDIVRGLNAEDRTRLAKGELNLSRLWRAQAQQRQLELGAKRPVQVHAAHGYVDRLIAEQGPEPIVEVLRYHLARRGLSLGEVVGKVLGADALMTVLDHITQPPIAGTAKPANGNGAAARV